MRGNPFTIRSGILNDVKVPKETAVRVGRPRNEAAISHAAILDAVYGLLQEMPARDLTMEEIAKRAGVGKPTLYKWWPTKAALIMATFDERFARQAESLPATTAEQAIRAKVLHLIVEFNGLFGKVMADLIAEGQSDHAVLQELYERKIRSRRAETVADIESGKKAGEFTANTDAEILVDQLFAPLYYRMLLRFAPLNLEYGSRLIDQVFQGHRSNQ